MNAPFLAVTVGVLVLALNGCGSDDDDDGGVPTATGQSADNDEDGTSSFNPELDPGAGGDLSSEPGDDTTAIAGLWDAATATDERYVSIEENGLYTDFDLQQDTFGDGRNCHLVVGPQTITLEDAETNAYSLADNRSFTATRSEDGRTLRIAFADDDETGGDASSEWPLVEGQVAADLTRCEGDAPGDP